MNSLPESQLQAIVDYWAGIYQKPHTADEMQAFKCALKTIIQGEVNQLTWDEENPNSGSYLRRFICCCENFDASRCLQMACESAGLSSTFAFPHCIMSIDPGMVYIGCNPGENIVWQVEADKCC